MEKVISPKDEDEEDEQPEELEIKHRTLGLTKTTMLGSIDTVAKLAIQTKGKGKDAGKWFTMVEVQFVIGIDGGVKLREVGEGGIVEEIHVSSL